MMENAMEQTFCKFQTVQKQRQTNSEITPYISVKIIVFFF